MKESYRWCLALFLCLIILLAGSVVACGTKVDDNSGVGPGDSGEVISALDTPKLLANAGSVKTVEGVIVRSYYAYTTKGQPTFLNFHDPYQGYFSCLIWGSDRGKFPSNPETHYLNKKVRVSGLIETYEGAPEIVLRDPSKIWFV